MKTKTYLILILTFCVTLMSVFSGCSLLDKIPEEYTEGIKYDRDYPDDSLEVYDNAIVYDSRSQFGDIVLSCGTEDDIDDIIEFYQDFFEDNDIIPDKEDEDRDEYFAEGISDSYSFKVQVEEAEGKYIEDVFEYTILLSVTPLSDEDLDNITQSPQEYTPAPDATATAVLEATPEPTQAPTDSVETPLVTLNPGSYQMLELYNSDGIYPIKINMYIDDNKNGTMYYFDYSVDERWMSDFSYTIADGIISFNLENGLLFEYYAFEDNSLIHFLNDNVELYYMNWFEYNMLEATPDEFTAFGSWMYYDPASGYIETISFWPDGSGYVYNWGGTDDNRGMFWDYDNLTEYFTFFDDAEEEFTYGILHKGEVFELHQSNGSVFFYDRITPDILSGTFVLEDSSEAGLEKSIVFYGDNTADVSTTINDATEDTIYSWYIDAIDGCLHMDIDGESVGFDYHYDLYGLIMIDYASGHYYRYVQVG